MSPGWAKVCDWLVPTSARPRQGTSVNMRPCDAGAASAMSLAGFDVSRLIALRSGYSRFTPNVVMIAPACGPAALTVAAARIERSRPVSVSRACMPAIREPSRRGDTAST